MLIRELLSVWTGQGIVTNSGLQELNNNVEKGVFVSWTGISGGGNGEGSFRKQ